mgnify:CR=1 FL=1|jgi:hypothetical protein|tara:strand:- start:6081 stop:7322 length:1242 start_codon:yes stop_codon:yes gene_type:complete
MQTNNIPSFKQYLVEEEREIFFTFGRMNPPTIGHGKLMDALSSKAGRNPYKVFLSQGQDAKKNPLKYNDKIKHIRKMFPKHGRNVLINKKVKTVFDALVNLYDQGYKKITMVVGEDRVTEFKILLEKYNGTKARHGFYNFEKILIVSAGQRDPDSEGVEGMSASKQRANVSDNDFSAFGQGLPKSLTNKDAKKLFNDVRAGMGLKESVDFKHHVDLGHLSETREKYIAGELFEPGDRVLIKESNQTGYIYRLGANYVIVALDEGKVSRQWLDGIVLEANQPEWGLPASTKHAKKVTPGESTGRVILSKASKVVRDRHGRKSLQSEQGQEKLTKVKISREKETNKLKHDNMLDRARTADARAKNNATNPQKEERRPAKNPVAKFASRFNKATVETDKKKRSKSGYVKHKNPINT